MPLALPVAVLMGREEVEVEVAEVLVEVVDEVLLVAVRVALLDVDEGVVAMLLLVEVVDVVRDLVDVAVGVDMTAVFTKHLQALLTRDVWISWKTLGIVTVEDARYFGQKAEAS